VFFGREFYMRDDSPFFKWLQAGTHPPFANFQAIQTQCFEHSPIFNDITGAVEIDDTPGTPKNFFNGEPYFNQDAGDQEPATPCQDLIQAYMNEKGFSVAVDTQVPNSWYIRKRSCIVGLTGSTDEFLHALGQPSPYLVAGTFDAIRVPIMLDQAIADTSALDAATLDAAIGSVHTAMAAAGAGSSSYQALLDVLVPASACVHSGHGASLQTTLKGLRSKFMVQTLSSQDVTCP
jgi:hypothetical protein